MRPFTGLRSVRTVAIHLPIDKVLPDAGRCAFLPMVQFECAGGLHYLPLTGRLLPGCFGAGFRFRVYWPWAADAPQGSGISIRERDRAIMFESNTVFRAVALVVFLVMSGCSGEVPEPGPESAEPMTGETTPDDAVSSGDDGVTATTEGNTEPPLPEVTSAVADVPEAGGAADSAGSEAVTLQVVSPSEFEEVVAGHKGKVVFVDFWATWCVPCRKAFPHTVELAKKYPEKLAVISMALDDADAREDVLAFLRKNGATFDNLMCAYGGADESYNAYSIPGAALPYFRIYDRDGSLKHTFGYDPEKDQGVDETQVYAALEKLISVD